jgi:hypothetical protein
VPLCPAQSWGETGVPFGHQQSKIQFPIGCRVEFDLRGQQPVLRYLEDLVAFDH